MTSSDARTNVGTKLQLRPERPVRKPRPRLDREAYVGKWTYHITLTTTQRAPFLEDINQARPVQRTLEESARRHQFRLLAYCSMPDHLHVLLRGESHAADLLRFVQRFKQVSSFHFKHLYGAPLWQQSFHDRVLRKDDSVEDAAAYVLDNPVAEGLPAVHSAYRLRGGEYFHLDGAADGAEASSLHRLSSVEQRGLTSVEGQS